MKAFILDRYGKQQPLRAGEMPAPVLRDNEVLIRVMATAVNVLDAKIRSGDFRFILPYRVPLVLGHDVAGVVVGVGPQVQRFKLGDEVFSRPDDFHIGSFAEFIAVREDSVAIKPKNVTMEQAASLPLVALTAWQALVEVAKLQKGQKVFIQAGSGGVGTIAIQLARHLGATVATTASGANADWLKGLGADIVIDYKHQDFETVLRDFDVVLHSQDDKTLEKSLRVLKPGGTLISISGPPDPDFASRRNAPWWLQQVIRMLSRGTRKMAARKGVRYSFLFMKASGQQLGQIAALVEAGAIHPVLDKIFPFDSTNEAINYVESGRAKGKVVIALDPAVDRSQTQGNPHAA